MKKVIIDVFGCDMPEKIVRGAAACVNEMEDVSLVLAGERGFIEQNLAGLEYDESRIEILDASQRITNDDTPTTAILSKRDSSLVVGMKALKKDSEAVGMITAGSTGAVLLASAAFVGRLRGVECPALASFLPTRKNRYAVLVDCGAMVDAKPEQMDKFALLGSALVQSCVGVEDPTVAVVSVGVEEKKGNAFSKEVYSILKDTPDINFVGNMEARDALSGEYDVMVCDGFTGNILLKSTEGSALFVVEKMVAALKRNLPEGVDGSFIKKTVGQVMADIDFTSTGGAMILGVEKPIIKAHGNSNEKTVAACVRQLLGICAGGYIEKTGTLLNK